jgi:hypothetical protein
MLTVTNKPLKLIVFVLNDVMLSVVAPPIRRRKIKVFNFDTLRIIEEKERINLKRSLSLENTNRLKSRSPSPSSSSGLSSAKQRLLVADDAAIDKFKLECLSLDSLMFASKAP